MELQRQSAVQTVAQDPHAGGSFLYENVLYYSALKLMFVAVWSNQGKEVGDRIDSDSAEGVYTTAFWVGGCLRGKYTKKT